MSKNLKRLFKPDSDISKYDNEGYMENPLLKFRLSEIKDRRHYTFLKRKAAEEKVKLCRQKSENVDNALPVNETFYANKLREYAHRVPIPQMSKTTELKIKSYAPKRLKNLFPDVVQYYMDCVHDEYNKIIKSFSIQKILVESEQNNSEKSLIEKTAFSFKFLGRTENYQNYLINRENIKTQLYITQPFIRAILNYSELDFPELLNDYGTYNTDYQKEGAQSLVNFAAKAGKDLSNNSIFIRKKWYPKMVDIIKKYYKKLSFNLKQWEHIFNCAKGLIKREINNLKIRTLNHLIEVILTQEKAPIFKFEITCTENVQLNPSFDNLVQIFIDISKDIANVGIHLDELEELVYRPRVIELDENYNLNFNEIKRNDEYFNINLNEIYLDEILVRLQDALKITYRPVLEYLESFQNKYYELYSVEILKDLEKFLTETRNFEDYFTKIESYKHFNNLLRSEVAREHFYVAVVHNSSAVTSLRATANFLIDKITKQIVIEHIKEEQEICNIFQNIKLKATEIPRSTEELLASGEYMLYVKTIQMFELQKRIRHSLKVGSDLIELTELSPQHIQIQLETINWLEDINIVFEQNATLYETRKIQFEEHLQEVMKKLNEDIVGMVPNMTVLNDMSDTEKFRDYYILLQNFIDKLDVADDYVTWINKEEKLFKFPKSQYPILEALKDFIIPFAKLIKLCIRWLRYYYVWMDGPFEYLEPKFVEETTETFFKEFIKSQKYYKNRIKQDLIGNPTCKFRGQTEDPDPEKHPVPLRLCAKMLQWIKDFRIGVFIVNIMCNSALRGRHWEEMSEIANFDITPDAGTTLRKIINYKLDNKLDSFEIISVGANKELQLQVNLNNMIKEWDTIEFPTGTYKNTDLTILLNLDDIQTLLDDHIIKTLSMRGSAFVKPCETQVREWYDKLTRVNKTFEEWGKVQSIYLYLLPIFSSKDIVAQMPEEGRLFGQVEETYKRYMTAVVRQPNVMETAPLPDLLEGMEASNKMLEDINNGVNSYLEKKRLYFPRFFFLSNDEMLEILSETKDPLRVQPHLSKCFEGIDRLEFDEKLVVHAMCSLDDEFVKFITPISTSAAGGSVEKWLLRVEEEMILAVRSEINSSHGQYVLKRRSHWVLDWPQMVVLCVSQIYWALEVHSSLQGRNQSLIRKLHEELTNDLNEIVSLVRSKSITNLNRITIKSLIVIDVHAKDVVEDLIKQQVHSESDFQWLAQLRYYWDNGDVLVKIINATVQFANEYLGNSDRLVITPLTDRCYRTLIGAYQLHLNGAPEGPAGTGKTETTKDLAKALAVQCKVFNCSDGLDYKAMGKFFKGLASCGAWACFDEFNRIELEVLSVIAQQILSIIQAVRGHLKKFIFEGTELQLNPACYVCITMNPGYAGRSELPDNLKVLFRSVAMMVPDYAMIGEISLYSYGFMNARNLSVKIVTTYRLCSEQLSSQNHYDYGMRAVKTVLSACGNIKKAFPDEVEDILLLRSLLDVNLAKFLSYDIPLFEGIISDLFPGVELPSPDYSLINAAFLEICADMNLQPKPSFLTKVIQTYEMMIVRHGFMMVGDPMAGKSSTLKVLAKVLSKLKPTKSSPYFQDVQYSIVNPKSITMGQLYGAFDPISYEWTDGVAAVIFRTFANDTSDDRKWLIFDGPVDAVWIENMNTVLDDNKKLCLTSGEVISMNSTMSIIFEVMDLAQASPATVSRCGMIYMETATLGWETFAESWLNSCDERWTIEGRDSVKQLLSWIIPPATEFVKKHCSQLLKTGEFSILRTTFDLFEMLIEDAIMDNLDEYQKYLSTWFQAALLFSVNWGIGGILDSQSREKFDVVQKMLWTGQDENNPIPESIDKIEISIPIDGLLIDYMYVFKQKGTWKCWPDLVKRMELEENALGMVVPTVDTGRYMYLLEMHIKHNKKFLLVGPTGTGKSFYMQNMLMNKLPNDTFLPAFITFTVMMTANMAQELFISKLIKRSRGKYGPPKGTNAIIFVDDVNMPSKEVYGAQPALELIRQYFDYNYWYDLKESSQIFLKDVLILSACGLPGGSRQEVYPRFLCHFNIFSINTFSDETMNKIFTTVLVNGLKKNGHPPDVINPVHQIVNATQMIYENVCKDLRPTPAKSHYIFNIRDISRICTGCALLKKESVENRKIFGKLWYHEAMRVFYDRLVDAKDQMWLISKLNDCVKDYFKERVEILFEDYCDENGKLTLDGVNRLLFGTYMDDDSLRDERKYEEIPSMDTFSKIANKSLEEYNAVRKSKMDIVLFTYALQHLSRICRIMSIEGGNALLVGIGGSGRQSLTKLAAEICGNFLYQPEITKNYGINDWHDDLKKVLKEAGGLGKDTVFLLTENQITMELFLQDIDCLLNLGEVPNLYPLDEIQEILEMVRLAAQGGNRNIDITPLQVFSYFINRCKQKLHIILCFSPIGTALRTRIRLYPSLVNCCTIDWFQIWPDEALQMVADRYLDKVEVPTAIKDAAVIACQYFHISANNMAQKFYEETNRKMYITSASYLELIKSFQNLTNKKQKEIMNGKLRYIGGLETLQQAAAAVAVMQEELSALQPKLVVMAENSKKMMIEINKETLAASAAAEQVKKDELVANAQATAAQALKAECEKDLAQAIPVLEDAIQALNTLKPADITLVKSMKNPPYTIKLVMAAVCVIKGVLPERITDPATGKKMNDYWGPSKRILGDMAFLQALKDFDKDNINPDIMVKIRKDFIPHKDFQPQIIAKASSAAEGLCKWIIAMDLYDAVAKIVAPKKANLAAAEKEYSDTMAILAEKREMAEALEKKVAKLNEELEKANAEMQRTQTEVEFCKTKLERAESLISSLGGEKSRWTIAADNLQTLFDHLSGDILISCGLIAYLSTVTASYRNECLENWFEKCKSLNIPCSEVYNFVNVLSSEITIQSWNVNELPRDNFSAQNAVIMDNSNRYSLFIDPQGQAGKWIKNMERNNKLKVVKFSQKDYMKVIEGCLEVGQPVLIENIYEELEVPLDPILYRNTFKQGGVEYISLGDNVIPISPGFRLYLTSNLRNPHFLPETFNKVTIINFSLTQQGLEDQLLGIVVAKERPDLQELRQILITDSAKNKATLKDVEEKILQTLSTCGGDILANAEAIEILDNSRTLSVDIQAKQAASRDTEMRIETFRLNYKPVAIHSSILYYSITDLPNIDPMYQFSLNWYINLYIHSIENANKSKDLARRLKFLMDAITENLYNNVCRAIFEKDKLLFSFILTVKIMMASNQIDQTEFTYLLGGGISTESEKLPNPDPTWISDIMWNDIQKLEQLKELTGFVNSFKTSILDWKKYYDHVEPHIQQLPAPWDERTNRFEKIIILHALRPDKVFLAITNFIEIEMGSQYISPPRFDIAKSFEDANCLSPLIFLLSPGADPMRSLVLFAEKLGFDETFQSISLGQGQGPIATKLIEEAQALGSWVCLQNCHLAASWMPTLEHMWENMDMYNTSGSFRLWVTSYPSEQFPVSLLQNGVKMTNEPPTGLQQNLLRSYNSEPMNDEKFYTGCPQKDRAFTRLLYGVCFFHAVVQERRKFGALGWNIPYGFNESDFQISVQQLQMFLNQYEEVPYVAISYLTAECNYGGRITDVWDRRAINAILADYVNENVVNDLRYKFADDDIYTLPRKSEHREVIRSIKENIPTIPNPEVYGLHDNAGITRDLQTSTALLNSVMTIFGTVAATSDVDSEKVLLNTIDMIYNDLPSDFDVDAVNKKYPVDYNESMNTVFSQEIERFLVLLRIIRKTCLELKDAVKGNIVMTPELEDVINAIAFKKVPTRWMSKSYPSLKPLGLYIQDFIKRINWLQDWFKYGKPPTFWVSGFFFTQAFLTGAMQNYARKYKISIDTLTFDFIILAVETSNTSPDDGVYVNGPFLEGARFDWNKGCLAEQLPKILTDKMPVIHLSPIQFKDLQPGNRYNCPLYKTAERKGTLSTTGHSTNYVISLLLGSDMPSSHWIKRSTALICQTNN